MLVLLLVVEVVLLTKTEMVALVAAQMALLVQPETRLVVVAVLSLLAVVLFLKQALHCKAVLPAQKAMAAALVAVVVDIGVVALVQIQTQALLAVVARLITTQRL
jgi:hypothetical protein